MSDIINKIIEKRPVTVILETPPLLNAPFSSQDMVMSNLGATKERLLGESVRYTLLHGSNTNYIELEAPLELINDNIDTIIPAAPNPADADYIGDTAQQEIINATNKFIDKAFDITTSSMLDSHAVLSSMPEVMRLHDSLHKQYGDKFELELKDVVSDTTMGTVKVTLELAVETDGNYGLPQLL